MKRILSFSLAVFAACLTGGCVRASTVPESGIAATLRAKDMALLDAVGAGDRKIWTEALGPHAIYIDETGKVMDRAAFLKKIVPLPAGVSGHIEIVKYTAEVSGDVATVVHLDREHEDFHGQVFNPFYLTSETWHRVKEGWKLLMVHVYAVPTDPPAIALSPSTLDDYVGRYRATPKLIYVIHRKGARLVGGLEGRPAQTLSAEVRDVFFVPGHPRSRKVFQRDASGQVTGFVDRREGRGLKWTRLP